MVRTAAENHKAFLYLKVASFFSPPTLIKLNIVSEVHGVMWPGKLGILGCGLPAAILVGCLLSQCMANKTWGISFLGSLYVVGSGAGIQKGDGWCWEEVMLFQLLCLASLPGQPGNTGTEFVWRINFVKQCCRHRVQVWSYRSVSS